MKKIYIKEESISKLKKEKVLPKFLFKLLKTHTTSLGDNEAFPSGDDFDFDYTIIKNRFSEVSDAIDNLGLESIDEDYLLSRLSSLIKLCKEREKPMRSTLEKMCDNLINKLFSIPQDILNMSFKLTDKVKFEKAPRIYPEPINALKYKFKDISDVDSSKKSIAKRRFVNSLVQGASYTYMRMLLNDEELRRICSDLIDLYEEIITINDYLLFIKKPEISDEKPMQGAYVETHLGGSEKRTEINVQGVIFPLLLQEGIRGLFELFSSHGLPKDMDKAKYIIQRADFIMAEPWDMRFGVVLWDYIFGGVEDTTLIPYMFMRFVKEPVDEFNGNVKEILASTEAGESIIRDLIDNATYNSDYQKFKKRINDKNTEKAIVNDGYFTASELDSLELDSDWGEGDVIEEDDID